MIHHSGHLFVGVPEGAHTFKIVKSQSTDHITLFWWIGEIIPLEFDNMYWEHLPPGSYSILGLASELGEEDWKGIVEELVHSRLVIRKYKLYHGVTDHPITATESGFSLLRHHGLDGNKTIVLRNKKADGQ